MPPSAVPPLEEMDVPASFNVSTDDEGVPQRALSDFVVSRDGQLVSICELDDGKKYDVPARATGRLTSDGESVRIETGDLTEWCVEYGPLPQLWIRSEKVWYNLGKPASEYSKAHDLAQRRFELCARIYILVTGMEPSESSIKVVTSFLVMPWNNMRAYREKDVLAQRDFILQQADSLNGRPLSKCAFFKELRARKVPASLSSPSNASGTKPASQKVSKKKKVPAAAMSGAGQSKQAGPWVPKLDQLDKLGRDRLLKKLEKVVASTMKMKKAGPFLQPVNPKFDGCPDYLERISRPMDYGTIWKRLSDGKHYKDITTVLADVRLIRTNCVKYNGDEHLFVRYAADVEKKFEKEARAAEESELKVAQKRMLAPSSGSARQVEKKARLDSDGAKESGVVGASGRKPPASSKSKGKKAVQVEQQDSGTVCISTASGSPCNNTVRPGSRYCGDECGTAVARKKLEALLQEGHNVDEYIQVCIGKALVGMNPLNR